ncbi:hypothetical protein ACHAW6_011055 [Cyclotella cf. meneghiniana]
MTNAPKGILRSAPRYPSSAPNAQTIIETNDAKTCTPARARPVRSLADLAKCSARLRDETHEIRVSEKREISRATSRPAAADADDFGVKADRVACPSRSDEDDTDDEHEEHEMNLSRDLENESVGGDDDDGDEEILMMLGLPDLLRDSCHVESNEDVREGRDLRPFRKLWEMLMQWTTPSTTELLYRYHDTMHDPCRSPPPMPHWETVKDHDTVDEHYGRNTVEIGASRRAGIMNMLRMNVSRSLSELQKIQQYDVSDRRGVEKRLANLVNTFDCSGRAADFDMKLWRGMTTILIAIVSPLLENGAGEEFSSAKDETNAMLMPPSIVALGLLPDEYRYLTKSALLSLSSTQVLNND